MTKRQLIDEITTINRTAQPGFLARFDEMDLDEYLRHLRHAQTSRLSGDASRYSKYFASPRPPNDVKEPMAIPARAPAPAVAPQPKAETCAVATETPAAVNNPAPAFRTSSTLPPAHRTLPAETTAATWLF